MKTIFEIIKLCRPVNGLITALGALLGNWIVPDLPWLQCGSLALALFLIVGAGNMDNDLCDLESDRINRPERALPAGRLRLAQVYWALGIAFILSMLLFALASWMCLFQGLLASVILFLYNRQFKRMPLIGNGVVAWLCAWSIFTPHFPHIPELIWPAMLFAFALTLVRELIKDAEDVDGDQKAGMNSTAVIFGAPLTLFLARMIWAVVLVLLIAPWQVGIYGPQFALAVVVLAAPPLVWGIYKKGETPSQLRQMSLAIKFGMLGGLISIFVGLL